MLFCQEVDQVAICFLLDVLRSHLIGSAIEDLRQSPDSLELALSLLGLQLLILLLSDDSRDSETQEASDLVLEPVLLQLVSSYQELLVRLQYVEAGL